MGMQHAWELCEVHSELWLENLKGRDHLENLIIDGRIILEWLLKK
jgi:hypothetical protein